jgi:hypothetical protein
MLIKKYNLLKCIMILKGRKLFEEIDTPTGSKVVEEDKVNRLIQRQSSWIGDIRGIDPFPSGKVSGSGPSFIHENGVTISHWQGVFTLEEDENKGEALRFKGLDTSKHGKFIVVRTYFTDSERLQWMNGLVCMLHGEFDVGNNCFRSVGYEWMY